MVWSLAWDWGGVSGLCVWICADTTLTPRPPLPPAGEGEKRARMGDDAQVSERGGAAIERARLGEPRRE